MEIEAGTLVTPEGVLEGAKLRVGGSEGSAYAETVIVPGFSDAHAHPQVVDYGSGRWGSAYEWLARRRLRVDEAALRADLKLSSKLAEVAMLRALLEGVTLVAFVGRLEANLRAYRQLPAKPRMVVMATVLDRRGWPSAWNALNLVVALSTLNEAMPVGFFVHSLGHVMPSSLRVAYRAARELGAPFGLHLSEGVDELGKLVSLLGLREGEDSQIVAAHCISGSGYRRYGVRVVHCPLSNIVLYGRTLNDASEVDALGSDWPILLGSAFTACREAVRVHERDRAPLLLDRATAGGYRVYGVSWEGDFVAFDKSLKRVLEGAAEPRFVAVRGELAVEEGVVKGLELSRADVDRAAAELVRSALELYPAQAVSGSAR